MVCRQIFLLSIYSTIPYIAYEDHKIILVDVMHHTILKLTITLLCSWLYSRITTLNVNMFKITKKCCIHALYENHQSHNLSTFFFVFFFFTFFSFSSLSSKIHHCSCHNAYSAEAQSALMHAQCTC